MFGSMIKFIAVELNYNETNKWELNFPFIVFAANGNNRAKSGTKHIFSLCEINIYFVKRYK